MIFDVFSKRAKRESGAVDVYQYERIPDEVKAQIILLFKRCLGDGSDYTTSQQVYQMIVNVLREEYGCFHLFPERKSLFGLDELAYFFFSEKDIGKCLDFVELAMRSIDAGNRDSGASTPEEVAETLNTRLREGGVGYQYESGHIIKVDNQFVHAEVVKPALALMHDRRYKGPNEEFTNAHRYYREGDYKACLNECLKSFESVMKVICKERRLAGDGETATKLISRLLEGGVIPTDLQTQFNALRTVLESGIPTMRNKRSAHGQGDSIVNVPEYVAAFALHQTASTIIFLARAHQSTSKR